MRLLIMLVQFLAGPVRRMSLVGLAAIPVVWIASRSIDPWESFCTVTPRFHLSLQDGCLVAFNDTQFGPFQGSLLWIDFIGPDDLQPISACDGPEWGPHVSWRAFYDPVQCQSYWTWRASLLLPAGLLLFLVVASRWLESMADQAARRWGDVSVSAGSSD